MKVSGLSSVTRSDPRRPSQVCPWNFDRQLLNPWSAAIRSAAMKPMLWRLCAYFAPGFPRPTSNFITITYLMPYCSARARLFGAGGWRLRSPELFDKRKGHPERNALLDRNDLTLRFSLLQPRRQSLELRLRRLLQCRHPRPAGHEVPARWR